MNIDLLEASIKYHGKELFKLISAQTDPSKHVDSDEDLNSKNLLFYSEEEKSVKKLDESINPQFQSYANSV
jgi:hypothetical protein